MHNIRRNQLRTINRFPISNIAIRFSRDLSFNVPAQFGHLMQCLTYFEMIFYIKVLIFHLSQLNWAIQRDMDRHVSSGHPNNYKNRILMRNNIKCYKVVHFRLWELSQERISEFFGWSMIFIFIHAFEKFVYTAFRIYREYQRGIDVTVMDLQLNRKFCLLNPVLTRQ